MRDECQLAVEDALGRALRGGEAKEIEDAVNSAARKLARDDPAGWSAKSQSDRMHEAGIEAATQMTAAEALKAQRVQLKILAHDRIENQLTQGFGRLRSNAKPGSMMRVVSQLLAFDAGSRGGVGRSVESVAKGLSEDAFGRLLPLWGSVKDVAGLWQRAGVRDVIKELFGEESGNPAAKAAAEHWRTVTDELRDHANSLGAAIGKLNDWHFPQSHSQSRIAQAGGHKDPSAALERWIGDTLPLLDREKYVNADGSRMNEEQMDTFMRKAWESIAMDGMNKRELGASTRAGSSIANRGSEHREIFFKDADSYMKYQGMYGEKNLFSTLTDHIRSVTRDIALMQVLGPTPEQTFNHFNDRAMRDEINQNPSSQFNKFKQNPKSLAELNKQLYDNVSGRTQLVNERIRNVGQTFRNMEVATKLGSVAISAMGDEAGMMATAYANKLPMMEVMSRELHYMNPLNGTDRDVAGHAGLGINSQIGGLNRFSGEDLALSRGVGATNAARTVSARLATSTLHLSGAEYMWDNRRKALGSVLMSYLGKTVGEVGHFADLNQTDHGILATKGIDENVWQTWKAAQPEDWGMRNGVLTPRSIRDIPDAALKHLGDPDTLRRNAATQLMGHVLEEVGMGVMESGAREKVANPLLFGTQSGTVAGELMRSVMLFKGFSASMTMKHWARAASLPTGGSTAIYAVTLGTISALMGAAAIQLRNLVSGKDPANMVSPKFAFEAIMRGGGLGFYGDFLYSEMTSHDTSLIPALMGPLATEAETAWNLTGGNFLKAARGERTDEKANLIRWGKSEIPVINNWYTKAALDHLVWNNLQEAASPGYLSRMTAKAQNQRGTSYYWDPHDSMPSAAPDFAKAFQPEKGAEEVTKDARVVSNLIPSLE